MKTLRTYTAAVALLAALPVAAHAADVYSNASTKDPLAASAVWTGIYAEIGVGPDFSQTVVAGNPTLSSTGASFDFRLGYDHSFGSISGSNIGLGVYGEVGDNLDVSGGGNGAPKLGQRWSYGGGLKAFYDYGTGQIYAIGGYDHRDIVISSWGHGLDGFKYGGGIQVKVFGPHVYAGLEVTQTLLGTVTTPASLGAVKITDTDDQVKVKLGYKF